MEWNYVCAFLYICCSGVKMFALYIFPLHTFKTDFIVIFIYVDGDVDDIDDLDYGRVS